MLVSLGQGVTATGILRKDFRIVTAASEATAKPSGGIILILGFTLLSQFNNQPVEINFNEITRPNL